MIDFIFTLDYEIYGNGYGSLKELVYEPALKLIDVFNRHKARLVFFIEVAELEIIESARVDPFINEVKKQIKFIKEIGFEIGLHIHPQWYEARLQNGKWSLNNQEYNLCLLSEDRIEQLLNRATTYLRYLVQDQHFTPVAFRAGNWLINPAVRVVPALARQGIKIDSSVFKGGFQRSTGIDYRQAPADLYYWKFTDDVNKPSESGLLLEIPIFTKMIPTWQFLRGKRLDLERKVPSDEGLTDKISRRIKDFLRWKVPLKFDFCRLNFQELLSITEEIVASDRKHPQDYKPIVLIGHTKDNPDIGMISTFLDHIRDKNIRTVTFEETYRKLIDKV